MIWGFAFIDRNNVRTAIEEPIGWDAFSIRIKRHPVRHGTFMEVQGNKFKFIDKAMELLKLEYELYGTEGQYKLEIHNKCGGAWSLFYNGTIDFNSYLYTCGTPCYVTAEVQKSGPLVNFLNRFDQKVNVDSNVCFDERTVFALASQNKTVTLPSKSFLLKAAGANSTVRNFDLEALPEYAFPGNDPFPENAGNLTGAITIPLDVVTEQSITDFNTDPNVEFHTGELATPPTIYNNPTAEIKCVSGDFRIDARVKGRFKYTSSGVSGDSGIQLSHFLFVDDDFTSYAEVDNMLQQTDIIGSVNPVDSVNSGDIPATTEFDISYSGDVAIPLGSKLYFFFAFGYLKFTDFTDTVEIEFDPETHFNAEVLSKCEDTDAKLRMIYETVDHVVESITNRELSLYSEFYGRTDSLPFSYDANGCGALRATTMGLDIRRVKLKDGTDPALFLSMDDCFNALNALDNIGLGTDHIEDKDVIRMEHWKWFYKDEIIQRCAGVDQIDKSVRTEQLFSIFKTGYDKWEAESFAGLDEFLTRRQYRTQLTQTQNTLEQICKWIASGYAIETTRRFGINDKDWRYDNDTFILCLTSAYAVELGNITCAANVVDPATLYNYRISPAHMAMRWFDRIMPAFRKRIDEYKLIFTSGDGNYIARGAMESAVCKPENGTLRENDSITVHRFANPHEDAAPIAFADAVKYQFPLSAEEYKAIAANPLGLIAYSGGCERGEGWIDELEYFPEAGYAKYNLIPKMDVTLNSTPEECCDEIDFVQPVLLDLEIEESLFIQVDLFGDRPFTILETDIPDWVEVSLTDGTLLISGTPLGPDAGVDVRIMIKVGGCNGSFKTIDQTIDVGHP